MSASEELKQQMWELCYDLLADGERDALVARIKSDPQAARLYAEVRLQADLVGYAAQVEDPSLALELPADETGAVRAAASPVPQRPTVTLSSTAARPADRRTWTANLLVMAAGLALALVIGYGYLRPPTEAYNLAGKLVITQIEAPARMRAGLTTELTVRTQSPEQEAVAAEVHVQVVDAKENVRFRKVIETNEQGQARFDIPGRALAAGVRLEVDAREKSAAANNFGVAGVAPHEGPNALTASLPVEAETPLLYFMFEQPVATPGESRNVAALGVSRFGDAVVPIPQDELVRQRTERLYAEQTTKSLSENAGQGQPPVHADSVAARPTLAAALPPPEKSAQKLTLEADTAPAPDAAKSNAAKDAVAEKLAEARRSLLPAQDREGQTAQSLDPLERYQRNFRAARKQQTAETLGLEMAETEAAIAGTFKKERAEDAANLPPAALPPGAPIVVQVPAEWAGKRLVANVVCRNVTVMRQPVDVPALPAGRGESDEQKSSVAEPSISLDVPPEVDGAIRIELIDVAQAPPQVVREQLVYRRPTRELQVAVQDLKAQYQPGETVRLRLKVLDENDQAAQATLGVRVWNEALVPAEAERPVLLADAVRFSLNFETSSSGPLELARSRPGDSEYGSGALPPQAQEAGELASSDPAAGGTAAGAAAPAAELASAASAVDAPAASTSEPRSAGEHYYFDAYDASQRTEWYDDRTTPAATFTLASNAAAVGRAYRSLTEQSESAVVAWRTLLGRVLVGGGLATLAILLLVFFLRIPVRAANGTLGLAAAAASLVVGMFWAGTGREDMQLAMTSAPAASVRAPDTEGAEDMSASAARDRLTEIGELDGTAGLPPSEPAAAADFSDLRGAGGFTGNAPSVPSAASSVASGLEKSRGEEKMKEVAPAEPTARAGGAGTPPAPLVVPLRPATRSAAPPAEAAPAQSAPATPENSAPASLYFNPRLTTDANGYVTIEFQMPAVESDYRVLIDAFGGGRIGSTEVLIVCRK